MIVALAAATFAQAGIIPSNYANQAVPNRFRGKTVLNKPAHFTEKVIALTFDDGPDEHVTPAILDSLKDANAKATFFVLGQMASLNPELVKRQVDEGHVVGSHTWSHKARPSQRKAGYEVWETARQIYFATGQWPSIFRPPYGIDNGWTARIARREGYASILWNKIGPDTVKSPTSKNICNVVISEARPGDIVLFHDAFGKKATAEALPIILNQLSRQGYRFVTVPELLNRWDSHIVAMEARREKARLVRNSRVNKLARS